MPRWTPPALAVAVLSLAACGGSGGDGGGAAGAAETDAPAEVVIDTFMFEPDPITVDAGTTVRFTNQDGTTHTVTAGTREAPATDVFDDSLDEGASTEITFDEPGTQPYFCSRHSGPGMTAEVVVRDG